MMYTRITVIAVSTTGERVTQEIWLKGDAEKTNVFIDRYPQEKED